MKVISTFDETAPFLVAAPKLQHYPIVLNSPHSGHHYPKAFLKQSRLDHMRIRRSEDCYVDRLFQKAAISGIPLLKAQFPRVFLDVNREPYELDPKMFRDPLPAYINRRSVRVAGGLGTIPKVVSAAENIYSDPLDVVEALDRIERLYKPYHETLRHLLAKTHVRYGLAVLVDCHSMPSNIRGYEGPRQPDVIVGDRYGKSSDPVLVDMLEGHLAASGLTVARNRPYAGGFITEHYGRPDRGLHAVQIEINRALYVNETTYELLPQADELADLLTNAMVGLGEAALTFLSSDGVQTAAE